MLPQINLVGRAVDDPELRFTQNGDAVANLRVVASERKKNQQTGEWEDGDRIFLSLSVWKRDAEAVAEDVRKGDKVTVSGALYQREYERQDGTKGVSVEVKWPTVGLVPGGRPQAQRSNAQQQQQQQRQSDPWANPPAPQNDPWANPGGNPDPPF